MENRPLNTPGFTDRMTRGELIAAAIYLPIHVVGIPFGISWLAEALPWLYTLSNTQLNVICYGLGLAFVLIGCAAGCAGALTPRSTPRAAS